MLRDISMYSLRISTEGMREPHWHPDTAEMGYVHEGNARMTIMNPNGSLDTWHLRPGDVYFIPRSYPHHIENTGQDSFRFLIFFDQPTPADIGYRAAGTAFSRETLQAMFTTGGENLPELPFTPLDPLIVRRTNPLDQHAVDEPEPNTPGRVVSV